MIIQEKSRSMESRPFISLSRKAFFFWCTFVMALFAGFFFAGTLVGRGQIQVDMGQNELFKEITGLSEPAAPADPAAQGVVTPPGEEPSDFEFYSNLDSKDPDKSMEVTIQPSTRKKVKQVVKKNLDIIKPDELEGVQTVAEDEPSPSSAVEKPVRDLKETSKSESPVPVTMNVTPEKTKTEAVAKTRKEPVEKTVTATQTKGKTETVEKQKTDPVQTVKAETPDKSKAKPETTQKSKPVESDKSKTSAPAKDKTVVEKTAEKSKKNEKPQSSDKDSKDKEKDKDSGKKFSLQVAALKNENDAADMVKKLNGLGFSAYTVKSGDSEVWYKVRVGSFKDRTDAEKTISKLKNKNFDAFIVTR